MNMNNILDNIIKSSDKNIKTNDDDYIGEICSFNFKYYIKQEDCEKIVDYIKEC